MIASGQVEDDSAAIEGGGGGGAVRDETPSRAELHNVTSYLSVVSLINSVTLF
jgi:hypothetical protein